MEIESLLTGSRWQLLQHIAQAPKSPLELSSLLQTTLANVSTQLRLLEMAGLVQKIRTKEIAAGKPRVIYSIKGEKTFIARIAQGNATKTARPLDVLENTLVAFFTLDVAQRNHLYAYTIRNAKHLEKVTFGVRQEKNNTIIGVVGEHSLQNAEDKPYKIIVRQVQALDGFIVVNRR